jgi:23S rRNA pseudouridine2605 synthase
VTPRKQSRTVGLARALSKLGYCSRSQAQRLIQSGRVRVNGAVKRSPEAPVSLSRDTIAVDSTPIQPREKIYLMLNKPRGLVTTASDEKGRATVYSALDSQLSWLAPVGRLDKASEGLLLLTNDSEWAARITAPETHLPKTYHVQVSGIRDAELAHVLMQGINVSGGDFLRATRVRILRTGNRNTWLEIVLDEGKNRHIRRMLEQLGIEVLRLVRVAIGPLTLGDLPKRASRPLTAEEKSALDAAVRISPPKQHSPVNHQVRTNRDKL